jgi:hypothetical protein
MDIFSTIAMYLMLVCLFEKQWLDDGFMKTHQIAPTVQADRRSKEILEGTGDDHGGAGVGAGA